MLRRKRKIKKDISGGTHDNEQTAGQRWMNGALSSFPKSSETRPVPVIGVRGSNVIPVASELTDDLPTNLVAKTNRDAGWIWKNIADRNDDLGADMVLGHRRVTNGEEGGHKVKLELERRHRLLQWMSPSLVCVYPGSSGAGKARAQRHRGLTERTVGQGGIVQRMPVLFRRQHFGFAADLCIHNAGEAPPLAHKPAPAGAKVVKSICFGGLLLDAAYATPHCCAVRNKTPQGKSQHSSPPEDHPSTCLSSSSDRLP
ncbi:hypothetical protein K449DRAFT_439315 [Hypoxylon sp. EC38]|nr:hypothetical protein K449DRAFT_439315 [Hypoxylon sp. EC38]